MAGLFPLSRMQQFDSNGRLLSGARLFLFDGGTGTPRVGYRDLALSSEHPNPILADSSGRLPLIYLDDGYYRQRLTSRTGTLVFDDDNIPVLTSAAGGTGTSVDPDSVFKTRDIKLRWDDQPVAGYVRLNGKTIGSATSGATERANVDTQPLYEELWLFANINVSGGRGASGPADFAANKPLVLPNAQGNSIFGMPNMGGTVDSAFAAFLTGTTAEPGAVGGADTVTLIQANVPSYTLTGGSGAVAITGSTSAENLDHTHAVSGTTSGQNQSHAHTYTAPSGVVAVRNDVANVSVVSGTATSNTGNASQDHSHTFSVTSAGASNNHSHTVTGSGTASSITISSGGSSSAVNKLPSLMTLMILVRL
jgi:hypothetical protein